jgi:hypothetical protein
VINLALCAIDPNLLVSFVMIIEESKKEYNGPNEDQLESNLYYPECPEIMYIVYPVTFLTYKVDTKILLKEARNADQVYLYSVRDHREDT